jgi:hypothetical protein
MGKAISVIVLLNQLSLPLSGLLVSAQSNAVDVQRLFLFAVLASVLASFALVPHLQCNSRILAPAVARS